MTTLKYSYISSDTNEVVSKSTTRTSYRVLFTDDYLQSLHISWSDMISDYLANSVDDTPLTITHCVTYIPNISYTLTDARTTLTTLELRDYYFANDDSSIPSLTVKTPPNIVHTVEADFTSWIGNAIQGFWSFQIFPNITIGAILLAILGLTLTLSFLKFFAGG